jgi:hypothetical protein
MRDEKFRSERRDYLRTKYPHWQPPKSVQAMQAGSQITQTGAAFTASRASELSCCEELPDE